MISPEKILTPEEIKKMAEVADNPRDKALVLTLYETGARIGEFLNIRIGDIKFDEYGARIVLEGKTGMRVVRVVAGSSALAEWLAQHPFREDKNAFIWIPFTKRSKNKPLSHRSVSKILKELAKKAGIKKEVYPHLFRHSRATELAKYLTEQQLKVYFGWEKTSDMAEIYVHLSGKDLDKSVLKAYGIEFKEKEETTLKPKVCPRCGYVNDPTAKFCARCGLPLTTDALIEAERKKKVAEYLMNLLFQDEEFVEFVRKKLEKFNLQV